MSLSSLLIIDDHPVYREALCEKLSTDFREHQISVIGVSDMSAANRVFKDSPNDWLALLDLKLPNSDPIENIKILRGHPKLKKLIAISGLDESVWEVNCIKAGADIFISKNNTSQFIYKKICDLLNISYKDETSHYKISLTKRQSDILHLMAIGNSNKQISDQLLISEQTVKIHVAAIFRIFNVSNRTQAVYKGRSLGLVS
jgi:DNA-binding NarL/FixJ family response regulator